MSATGRPIERMDEEGVRLREAERKRYQTNAGYREAKRLNTLRMTRERRELLRALKGTVCWDCGQTFPPEKLHFHHRNPLDKLFNVSSGLTRPLQVFLTECRKCDRLCGGCHSRRHRPRRQHEA